MTAAVAGAVGVLVAGIPGGLAAVVATAWWHPRRRRPRLSTDVIPVAARLLVLVGAGSSVVPALRSAVEGSGLEPEIVRVVRRSRRLGAAAAFASATGPLAPLLRRLGEATLSGAAMEPAIRSFIEAERRRRHLEAVERARRLPVRLMIPMTLLVLPGFVLVVYGPALIGMVTDLLGPLSGG